jgi:murein DD-endopeptidase MepM/ murein hydrolase activator NlpD
MQKLILRVALLSCAFFINSLAEVAADEVGRLIHINPRLNPPGISVPLDQLGSTTGDYLGFRIYGNVQYKQSDAPVFSDGVFMARGAIIPPSNYGADDWLNGDGTFQIPWWSFVIFRAPEGATSAHFSVFSDFCCRKQLKDSDGDYGVRITRPNSPLPTPNIARKVRKAPNIDATQSRNEPDKIPDHIIERILERVNDDPRLPELAPNREQSETIPLLSVTTQPPVPEPQYRGWYRACEGGKYSSCWRPDWSRFCDFGARSVTLCPRKKKHLGIDVFAPAGSFLEAPVEGILDYATGNNGGFGNLAWIAFKIGKTPHVLMFAHLSDAIVEVGPVTRGTKMARAGCTGNAGTQWCSSESPEGGRSDHVHIELVKGRSVAKKFDRLDPAATLNWDVRCTGDPC